MEKPIYQSKTVWSAFIAFVFAVLQFNGYAIPEEIYIALGSMGIYGIRDSIK
jgi:hypothetical protein|tara:strand:+ start:428 stop:583 length:156 start_codon:yes stop_codon:yes gene_type:complete